jgi:hypothetical protein
MDIKPCRRFIAGDIGVEMHQRKDQPAGWINGGGWQTPYAKTNCTIHAIEMVWI